LYEFLVDFSFHRNLLVISYHENKTFIPLEYHENEIFAIKTRDFITK